MAIRQTRDLERVLQQAVDHGEATAILLHPDEPVALRVGQSIVRLEGAAIGSETIREIAAAAIGEERLARVGPELAQVVTSCGLPGVVDARMSITRSLGSFSLAIRLLRRSDLSGLARRCRVPAALIEAAHAPSGLVVVTGPANSGKTTTQYALLEEINQVRPGLICTVEYALGMVLPPREAIVQQREIGVDAPDCLAAIHTSIAQDADVLFVGELRSPEEVEACIRAACCGRLVITQLHVRTAIGALQRMCEVIDDVTRGQLAHGLLAVAAQQLLPRADGQGAIAAYAMLTPDEPLRAAIAAGEVGNSPEGEDDFAADVEILLGEGLVTAAVADAARGDRS